jgi:DNA modification methylase
MIQQLNTPTQSDVFSFMNTLPDQCVQTVVTSPPYFGLRNYKIPDRIWGGESGCEHEFTGEYKTPTKMGLDPRGFRDPKWIAVKEKANNIGYTQFCSKCFAWKGSLGAEPVPELFVSHLVEIFESIKPKLHDTGTLWVNLGDSYARSSGSWGITENTPSVKEGDVLLKNRIKGRNPTEKPPFISFYKEAGYKPKDLLGIPWAFAFAMRDAGWYLRQDIIWNKPNPMPAPVKDRCTTSHEYIFLFSKMERYFYDHYAIMEPIKEASVTRYKYNFGGDYADELDKTEGRLTLKGKKNLPKFGGTGQAGGDNPVYSGREYDASLIPGRNRRDVWHHPILGELEPNSSLVWSMKTGGLPRELQGEHFAAFPEKLPELCILAGTPHKVCAKCRAPYKRIVENIRPEGWEDKGPTTEGEKELREISKEIYGGNQKSRSISDIYNRALESERVQKGFEPWEEWKKSCGADKKGGYKGKSKGDPGEAGAESPSDVKRRILEGMGPKTSTFATKCKCGSSDTVNAIVLDPFSGTYTTAVVAERLGRDWLGCDVADRFVDLGKKRLDLQVRKGRKLKQMEYW